MEKAERMMNDNPTEALEILDRINPSDLDSDKDSALYALLLTQARNKNFILETNDSLITKAVDYYDHAAIKDREHRMWSHYYRGVIGLYSENYASALSDALIALSLCKDDRYFAKAQIHNLISDLYTNSYNMPTAIGHKTKAVEFYNKARKRSHAYYASAELANFYLAVDSIKRSFQIIDSLERVNDPEVNSYKPIVKIAGIYAFLASKEYGNALKVFEEIINADNFVKAHYSPIAFMYASLQLPDSAENYLRKARETNPDYLDDE